AEEQVKEIAAELQRRNPGFDGRMDRELYGIQFPVIEGGVVRGVSFFTDAVRDLTPLRVWPGLKTLGCLGGATGKGNLADLSPLRGMPLQTLCILANPPPADLSPVADAPLERLECWGTAVHDLAALQRMPLTILNCSGNRV